METFTALLAVCVGNSPVTGVLPHYDVIVTSPGYTHLSRFVVFCLGYIDLAAQW